MIEKGSIYKFGGFTFRVSEYYLMKGNEELSLRPKTCQTLQYLIEHHGNVVKKEELIENVWSDTVVTGNTLTQCIKEIREKLGDSSENPQFIKTIPRVGYKFIAPVKKIVTQPNLQYEKSEHRAHREFIISKSSAGIIFLMVLVVSAIIFFLWNKEPAFNFSNRDWVLITNFDNRTGEDVFEYALRTALEMEISESKYVNVVPKGRVMDILNLMKQDPGKRIDRELGREVCLRDGNIQILVSGSLYKIGNTYSISVELTEPVQNTIIKIFSEKVNDQQQILPAISRLAISIRRELGESMKSIPRVKGSYELVTTPSLKALNFYSKGYHYMNLFDFGRAQFFLKQAIRYDSSFAMSYVLLGFAELWSSHLPQGKYNFAKAASLVDNLSEREKFFILGANAVYNLGDYKKGIENYELLLNVYPDDFWGNENISRAYLWSDDIKNYRKYKNICRILRPNYFINYSDNGLYALYIERNINNAHSEFSRALELNPDFPFEFPYLSDAFLFWMNDETDSAENKVAEFLSFRIDKLLPMAQITGRWFASRFYFYTGRFNEGIKLLNESVDLSQQQPDSKLLPWAQMELALVYLEMGKTARFESMIKNVIVNYEGIARVQALGWLAIHYAKTGKTVFAKKLLGELKDEDRMMPFGIMQPPLRNELNRAKRAFTYQIEGEIAMADNNQVKARELFNKVIELIPPSNLPALTALNPRIRWAAIRSLALNYEKAGDRDSALALYQKITDEKILMITVPAASQIWVETSLLVNKLTEKNR